MIASGMPPLWRRHRQGRLSKILQTEIAIVGAGYTGLVTALRLAERGIEPVVVEAKQVGFGGSGRNLGHCTPTFHYWPL